MARTSLSFIEGKPIKAVYIDPSAASFKAELSKQGVQSLFDAENEVLDGIRLVGSFFRNGTLKICRSCDPVIKEMQSYVWDEKSQKKGIDTPKKTSDHTLDAIRYACYTHFFGKDGTRLTPQELDRRYAEAMGSSSLPAPFQDVQGLQGF